MSVLHGNAYTLASAGAILCIPNALTGTLSAATARLPALSWRTTLTAQYSKR